MDLKTWSKLTEEEKIVLSAVLAKNSKIKKIRVKQDEIEEVTGLTGVQVAIAYKHINELLNPAIGEVAVTGETELDKVLKNFIEFRKTIKKPLTPYALELLKKKLDRLANDDETKIKILNQSILNGWQGIYSLRGESDGLCNYGRGHEEKVPKNSYRGKL